MFNLGLKQQHDFSLSGDGKEDSVHIVGHCPVLASKRNRILGRMSWRPKALENVRVKSKSQSHCN